MVTFFINILAAIILTVFTTGVYNQLPETAFISISIFIGWYFILWLLSYFYDKNHFVKIPKIIGLIIYYFKELLVASIKVAFDIITPKDYMKPAIIAFPLNAKTDLEITLLANLITLTPGTLSIDVSDDKKILYIHELYVDQSDLEAKKTEIKDGFEKRILNITR
ncbi:MAG: Na+/H+ antiporter subunit E [Candidatus Cyclobacteriaceae bacterium M3_2C_046]